MQEHEYLIETRGLSRRFAAQVAVDDLNLLVPRRWRLWFSRT